MFRTGLFALLLCAALAVPAKAEIDSAAYRALNNVLVEDHIVPRYAKLAEAAAHFGAIAERICDMPTTTRVADLRKAAIAAQNAWQRVQHIRFGPIERELRSTRFAFWPDVRNRTGRELAEILHARDREIFKPDQFPKQNVVIQGFPALERLLFDSDSGRLMVDGTVDAHFRCSMVRAIAANLAAMSKAVYAEWTEGDGSYANVIARAGIGFGAYEDVRGPTLDLFKSLHTAVELVADQKLARPMGANADAARPKRAESWRSGQSLENIRRNLEAAQAMYLGENGSGARGFSSLVRQQTADPKLDDLLRRAFAQTLATANSIKLPLREAVSDPIERAKLAKLKTEASALKTILAQRLTVALGIPLGFNALDGD